MGQGPSASGVYRNHDETLLEESIELTRPMWQAKRNVSIVRQFEPIGAKSRMLQSQHVVSRLPLQCSPLVKSGKTTRAVHRRRTPA